MFHINFTRTRLCYIEVQFMSSHLTAWDRAWKCLPKRKVSFSLIFCSGEVYCIKILSSHLHLAVSSYFFPWGFPTIFPCYYSSVLTPNMCHFTAINISEQQSAERQGRVWLKLISWPAAAVMNGSGSLSVRTYLSASSHGRPNVFFGVSNVQLLQPGVGSKTNIQ
jgi:hypothetical protein